MTVHVSISLEEELKAQLDALADARGMSLDHMLSEALTNIAEEEQAVVQGVARGRSAVAAGDVADHADVVATFEARRAAWRAA